ncbi:MAG: TFIIB-type zinc ribbon-containing protein [Eubacterium sp.]|nr:TFIIB-type zinc ribbon-containing protein [Eubacterium sp.]
MGMVALKCPGCGANIELDESREFGFCNFCGTKLMQDKVVVEHQGTVNIDNTNELNNLYMLARRAKDNKDTDNAQKYYEQIIVKDPMSWEANFYTVYYQSMNCIIANISSAAVNMTNNLNSTFQLVRQYIQNKYEQRAVLTEIVSRVNELSIGLAMGATNHFNGIDPSIKNNYVGEYNQRMNSIAVLDYYCGDYIESMFGTEFAELIVLSWNAGVITDKDKQRTKNYHNKIKQYDPNHKIPKSKFVTVGLPIIWFFVLCFVFSEVGDTAGGVFLLLSIAGLIAYIVLKILKKNNAKKQ